MISETEELLHYMTIFYKSFLRAFQYLLIFDMIFIIAHFLARTLFIIFQEKF